MIKKINNFINLSLHRKYLLLLTFGLSFYSFLLMDFFEKYARFGNRNSFENPEITNYKSQITNDIRWAIFVVNKNVPWTNVCRHQAYQAKILCSLYKIPYQIFVGFKKSDGGKIEGHAWTVVGAQMITGFCNPDEYVIQNIFS